MEHITPLLFLHVASLEKAHQSRDEDHDEERSDDFHQNDYNGCQPTRRQSAADVHDCEDIVGEGEHLLAIREVRADASGKCEQGIDSDSSHAFEMRLEARISYFDSPECLCRA